MKKIVVGVILIITIIGIYKYVASNKKVMSDKSKEQIKSNDMLTMMLETEAGTGVYEETKASEWPTDGYIFNETLSKCENGGTLTWDDENKKVEMQSNTSDKCYIYFDIANQTFANYIIENIYTEDGVNGLYYHDGVGTYTNASEEAGDNSYRYSGANPNNYVCFGSDATTCPEDNLYRIIGLFDDDQDGVYNIKLIKNTSIGDYAWDSGTSNTWNATEKPDIYTTLNTTYWNTLSSEWQNLIDATYKWQVGGATWSTTNTVKQYYGIEIKNQTGYEETMAIGLMYVSDYGYSSSPENWQTALYDYLNTSNTNNNWLYLGDEWTISRTLDTTYNVFYVYSTGFVHFYGGVGGLHAVRPAIYLKSEIALESGTGSASDPYRLNF